MSAVISLEEAARRTGLTKRQIGDKVAEGKLRIERDPVTGEKGIYPHTLRGLNGYQPPEPSPPSRPQSPPPPKPEPWIPSHPEMAALIKLDGRARDIRVAELVRQHPHLKEWFRDNLPPVYRKPEPPPQQQAKPVPPQSWQWQTDWQYQTPPKPEPPPVKPAPPDPPPKQQQPPPHRPVPPQPPPRPSVPSPSIPELLRLLLVELSRAIAQPFEDSREKLKHIASERRQKLRGWIDETEYMREAARLWDNKAGRTLVILVVLYISWRIL